MYGKKKKQRLPIIVLYVDIFFTPYVDFGGNKDYDKPAKLFVFIVYLHYDIFKHFVLILL